MPLHPLPGDTMICVLMVKPFQKKKLYKIVWLPVVLYDKVHNMETVLIRPLVKSVKQKIIFLFLIQNICCGYSKEPSQCTILASLCNWAGWFWYNLIGKTGFIVLQSIWQHPFERFLYKKNDVKNWPLKHNMSHPMPPKTRYTYMACSVPLLAD